jgi:hypothetical protein
MMAEASTGGKSLLSDDDVYELDSKVENVYRDFDWLFSSQAEPPRPDELDGKNAVIDEKHPPYLR